MHMLNFILEFTVPIELKVWFCISISVFFSDVCRFKSVDFVEVNVSELWFQYVPSVFSLLASIVIANSYSLLPRSSHRLRKLFKILELNHFSTNLISTSASIVPSECFPHFWLMFLPFRHIFDFILQVSIPIELEVWF